MWKRTVSGAHGVDYERMLPASWEGTTSVRGEAQASCSCRAIFQGATQGGRAICGKRKIGRESGASQGDYREPILRVAAVARRRGSGDGRREAQGMCCTGKGRAGVLPLCHTTTHVVRAGAKTEIIFESAGAVNLGIPITHL